MKYLLERTVGNAVLTFEIEADSLAEAEQKLLTIKIEQNGKI